MVAGTAAAGRLLDWLLHSCGCRPSGKRSQVVAGASDAAEDQNQEPQLDLLHMVMDAGVEGLGIQLSDGSGSDEEEPGEEGKPGLRAGAGDQGQLQLVVSSRRR
jgi:hypothetical protein